ncbi:MAG: leucine-rich repeat protein, partial [Lachnospiraceae bacterium]|nr:leucine-rich repeat protein [Lachnospiraceae bacterium]
MFAKYIGSGTEIVALSDPVTMGVNVFGQLFSFIDKDSVERTAFYVWGTDGAAEICSYQLRDSDNNLLNNYYNNSELNVSEGIVIENGIKTIGRNAFYRGKAKWAVLPETLEKLDYGAFYDQSLIETINLQECLALTEIGDYAFNYNAKLDGIVIPDSVVKIGEGAFNRCESLTHINLPKNLVDLGNNAFVNCKMLVSDETDPLVIPKTIKKCYTNGAFSGCPLITAVKLEDGMTEVVNNCLAKLSYITEISIPSTVTKIGETAFNGCSSLAVINLNGAQIESVGSQAFKDCKALGSFELPDSLKTLGGSAFYGCEMLKSIDIPDGICSLDGVFEGCISLRSVRLPSDIMTLDNTFNGCISLERIDLPNSLRRIGRNTFKNTSLKNITIPDGVTGIYDYAFNDCPLLETVSVPAGIYHIGSDPFPDDTAIYYRGNEKEWATVRIMNPKTLMIFEDNSLSPIKPRFTGVYEKIEDMIIEAPLQVKPGSRFALNVKVLPESASQSVYFYYADFDAPSSQEKISPNYTYFEGLCDGIFKAVQNGKSSIVCYTKDGSLSKTVEVTVSDTADPSVYVPSSVVFAGGIKECNVSEGKKISLYANVLPATADQRLTWSSSDPSIVSVDSKGVITGIKAGQTKVTASSVATPEINASIDVTVNAISLDMPNYKKYLSDKKELAQVSDDLSMGIGVSGRIYSYKDDSDDLHYVFYIWSSDEGTKIDDYTSKRNTYYNDSEVTGTKPKNCEGIIIEEGITRIGYQSFYNGKEKWVILPASLAMIGNGSFTGNSLLESVNLEECTELKEIGASAFYNTSKLQNVVLPDNVLRIKNYAFSKSGIKKAVLPKNVLDLGSGVFFSCADLVSDADDPIVLPKAIRSVASDGLFGSCPNVTAISFEDGITEIPSNILNACGYLKSIKIPSSVTKIGDYAFKQCSQLENVDFNGALVTSIGVNAFTQCSSLVSITLPESVSELKNGAFSYCTSLTSITIPAAVKQLDYTFDEATSLTSVTFAGSPVTMAGTFRSCTALTKIELPEGVRVIGSDTFKKTSLTDVYVPDGVVIISDYAFGGCEALTSVSLPASIDIIRLSPFPENAKITFRGNEKEWANVKIENPKTLTYFKDNAESDIKPEISVKNYIEPVDIEFTAPKVVKPGERFTIVAKVLPEGASQNVYFEYMDFYGASAAERISPLYCWGEGLCDGRFKAVQNGTSKVVCYTKDGVLIKEIEITVSDGSNPGPDPSPSPSPSASPSPSPSVSPSPSPDVSPSPSVSPAPSQGVSPSPSPEVSKTPGADDLNVAEIVLNMTQVSVYPKGTVKLSTTINPANAGDKTVRWASSDETFAKVDENGLVTALKSGTDEKTGLGIPASVEITAISNADENVKAVCFVTILPSEVIEKDDKGEQINPDIAYSGDKANIWVAGLNENAEYFYTGNAIKPEINVYKGYKLLTENTDYKLTYKNNKNVSKGVSDAKKKPQIVIKLTGNYKGSEVVYFDIVSMPLDKLVAENDSLTAQYKAKKKNQIKPVLMYEGAGVKAGSKDVEYVWMDDKGNESGCIEPGTYTVKLKAGTSGNYTGSNENIAKIIVMGSDNVPMSNVKIKGFKSSLPYDKGNAVTQDVTLSYKDMAGNHDLKEGTDYTVSYENNIDLGTATVTFEAIKDAGGKYVGKCSGKLVKNFKITGKYVLTEGAELSVIPES